MIERVAQSPVAASAHLLLSYQWRALNYCLTLFGNVPLGQHFVHITLMTVHSRGWHPTVQELTAITGLTRPSVSRHLNALISAGLVREEVDTKDRRRRLLRLTRRGEKQRVALIDSLTRLNVHVTELVARSDSGAGDVDLPSLRALSRMADLVQSQAPTESTPGTSSARVGRRTGSGQQRRRKARKDA